MVGVRRIARVAQHAVDVPIDEQDIGVDPLDRLVERNRLVSVERVRVVRRHQPGPVRILPQAEPVMLQAEHQ